LLRLRESSRYRNEADMAEIYEYAPIFTEQQVVILGCGEPPRLVRLLGVPTPSSRCRMAHNASVLTTPTLMLTV
jgi:hypothetical protein